MRADAYRKHRKSPHLNSAGFFSTRDHEVTTMRVLKFGGTSVANAERFLRVADILESNARQGQVATVLSAPAKITNHLVAMIEKLSAARMLCRISAMPNVFFRSARRTCQRTAGIPACTVENGCRTRIRSDQTCFAWYQPAGSVPG